MQEMISDETNPIGRLFLALLDLNIIYKSKYFDILYVEHSMYVNHVLKQFVERKKEELSFKERMQYKLFCRAKGVKLGTSYSGMPYLTDEQRPKGEWLWTKTAYSWEFAELYYRLDKPEKEVQDTLNMHTGA